MSQTVQLHFSVASVAVIMSGKSCLLAKREPTSCRLSCSLCILNAVSIAAISNAKSLDGTDSRDDVLAFHVPYGETQVPALGCLIVEADEFSCAAALSLSPNVVIPRPFPGQGSVSRSCTRSRSPSWTAENVSWLNDRGWILQLGGLAFQQRSLFVRSLVARPHSAITRGRVFRTFFVCHLVFLLLSHSSIKTKSPCATRSRDPIPCGALRSVFPASRGASRWRSF